jgi:hypothetical protein
VLFRGFQRRGIERAGDDQRLSQEHFQALMANRSVSDRIALKQRIGLAGIWPRDAA